MSNTHTQEDFVLGTFRVLSINDVYAFGPVQGNGGYAEISTLIQQYKTDRSVVTVNGDFLGGSPLGQQFKGKCVIDVLNALNIDVCVTGNHEFDFGNDILRERMKESNFVWLGSNIKDTNTNQLFGSIADTWEKKFTFTYENEEKETVTKDINVGFFGVCTLDTPVLSWPGKDVRFEPVLECAREQVHHLQTKQSSDVIIAITHVAMEDDIEIGEQVKGIDLILGGHDHYPHTTMLKSGTLLVKSGQNAYWLGIVDFQVELCKEYVQQGDKKVILSEKINVYPSWQLVTNRKTPPDPNVLAVIERYESEMREISSKIDTNEVICRVINHPITTRTSDVRCGPAKIANYVADALWKSHTGEDEPFKSQFAIINGGVIRGDSVYAVNTDITLATLMTEFPFPLTLVQVKIKGKSVKLAVEQHLAKYPAPLGSFPHFSANVRVTVDANRPPMERLVSFTLNDVELEDEQEYIITITKFLSIGGDGCSGYTEGTVVGTERVLFGILMDYLRLVFYLDGTPDPRLFFLSPAPPAE